MKIWQEIKIVKNSTGAFSVYLARTDAISGRIHDSLQGIYKTRKRIYGCISNLLPMLLKGNGEYNQDPNKRTDTERLNAIQNLEKGYGKGWVLRNSIFDRGLRLHETKLDDANPDIRIAIDNFLDKLEKQNG